MSHDVLRKSIFSVLKFLQRCITTKKLHEQKIKQLSLNYSLRKARNTRNNCGGMRCTLWREWHLLKPLFGRIWPMKSRLSHTWHLAADQCTQTSPSPFQPCFTAFGPFDPPQYRVMIMSQCFRAYRCPKMGLSQCHSTLKTQHCVWLLHFLIFVVTSSVSWHSFSRFLCVS